MHGVEAPPPLHLVTARRLDRRARRHVRDLRVATCGVAGAAMLVEPRPETVLLCAVVGLAVDRVGRRLVRARLAQAVARLGAWDVAAPQADARSTATDQPATSTPSWSDGPSAGAPSARAVSMSGDQPPSLVGSANLQGAGPTLTTIRRSGRP